MSACKSTFEIFGCVNSIESGIGILILFKESGIGILISLHEECYTHTFLFPPQMWVK